MIHLLHDDTLTQENREKFLRTVQKYSQEIEFVNIEKYKSQLTDELRKFAERWTIGTLFRLFIPEVLDLDKVIYLDSDILVNLDIKNFWDIDFEEKSLVGIREIPGSSFIDKLNAMRKKLIDCDDDTYINSGVLMMNLRKIRERGSLFELVVDWMLKNRELLLAPDQDALNSLFHGDIKFADRKFNVFNTDEFFQECMIHALLTKPWAHLTGKQSDRIYWKMYTRNAWGEDSDRDELIDKFSDIIFAARHSNERRSKRILEALERRLKWLFIIAKYSLKAKAKSRA